MADTKQPVPAVGLHVRTVDPTLHKFQASVSRDGISIHIPNVNYLLKNFQECLGTAHKRWCAALWPIPPSAAVAVSVVFAGWVTTQPPEWYVPPLLPLCTGGVKGPGTPKAVQDV